MKLLYTTLPNEEAAKTIAQQLVSEKVVACATWRSARSCYTWEDTVTIENEVQLFCKTTNECIEAAKNLLVGLHPYDMS